MSDLFCPATLLLAAAAETRYDDADAASASASGAPGPSDAAGPAADGPLSEAGREQAAQLGAALAQRRVAAVYVSDLPAAAQTGALVAAALAVPTETRSGLRAAWIGDELAALADQLRGETALVVSDARSIAETLPVLADNVADDYARARALPACATCEVSVDADGWVLVSWAGEPV